MPQFSTYYSYGHMEWSFACGTVCGANPLRALFVAHNTLAENYRIVAVDVSVECIDHDDVF